jgi:hypothetical protein
VGTITDQLHSAHNEEPEVRCPICGAWNARLRYCRHVRWTFDQGDPIDFARFALETSAYQHPRGYRSRDIPQDWWQEHGEYVLDRVIQRFHADEGYVFGELADLDLLTLDVWRAYAPEPERAPIRRQ